MLCDVFKQAGLPEGVVNIVFGSGKLYLKFKRSGKFINLTHTIIIC